MPARASERELRTIDDCLRRVQRGTEIAAWLFAIAILVTACVWTRPADAAEAARPAIPIRFTLDKPGVVRWRYPAISIGNHAGYVSPAPSQPGQLIAVSSLAGPPFTPRGTKERLWATVGLKGNLHVMTTDGLFVATLFKDYRQGKPGPEKADRGAILNDMSLGDDAWSTTLTQSSDGMISIVGGHDSTWVTLVDGLESIRRLPESEVSIVEPPAR